MLLSLVDIYLFDFSEISLKLHFILRPHASGFQVPLRGPRMTEFWCFYPHPGILVYNAASLNEE